MTYLTVSRSLQFLPMEVSNMELSMIRRIEIVFYLFGIDIPIVDFLVWIFQFCFSLSRLIKKKHASK